MPLNLDFELESGVVLGQEVVIFASRTPERILGISGFGRENGDGSTKRNISTILLRCIKQFEAELKPVHRV